MRKHIYLHTSNLDHSRDFNDEPDFQPIPEYDPFDCKKSLQYEWGRFKTKTLFLHIILGNPPQENCPWCNGPCELRKINDHPFLKIACYSITCLQCHSNGPVLNLLHEAEDNVEAMNHFKALMWQQFKNRRMWDHEFQNPHENYEKK